MPISYNEEQKSLTKRSLEEALIMLLRDAALDKITVKQLCELAGTSRMAFYRHFSNLQEVLASHFEGQQETILSHMGSGNAYDRQEIGQQFLQKIREERWLYKILFREKLHHILRQYIESGLAIVQGRFARMGAGVDSQRDQVQNKYELSFAAGGLLSVIETWVTGDCKDDVDPIIDFLEVMEHQLARASL